MRALAGPAMLLVVFGGFAIYKLSTRHDAPSRDFTELEFAADDAAHSGTCYSLSTVLIANGVLNNRARSWSAPDGNAERWTLTLEAVRQGYNGPEREYQKFTFERHDAQVRLVSVDASEGFPTQVGVTVDRLLEAPHARRSTPVDRCNGGSGYQFPPK